MPRVCLNVLARSLQLLRAGLDDQDWHEQHSDDDANDELTHVSTLLIEA